ncbi:MAG: cytochrome P460 family protein [Myxococcota bacterium]
MRRFLAFVMLAAGLAACGPMETEEAPRSAAHPDYPDDYKSWKHVNDAPIVREDEGIVREIYTLPAPELGQGTVIVKEQYRLAPGGGKGDMEFVGVMRRTGADVNNGWVFQAFDPSTKREAAAMDSTACVGCHTLQEGNDFLFTPRTKLLP